MRVGDIFNEYAAALGDLFDRAPKAVIAAVAVSALTEAGEHLDQARARFLREWDFLHANGIVTQAPPRSSERRLEG